MFFTSLDVLLARFYVAAGFAFKAHSAPRGLQNHKKTIRKLDPGGSAQGKRALARGIKIESTKIIEVFYTP